MSRFCGATSLTTVSSITSSPSEISSSPASMRSAVVLPQPDGPTRDHELAIADLEIQVVDGSEAVVVDLRDTVERHTCHVQPLSTEDVQRVLDALRADGPLRVTELVSRTGLSQPTVDVVAGELVRLGWLSEVAAIEGARGRPARSLAFRADAGYVAGGDIGEA